jgi:drug/metabolite transporter (DMT)-like permease
MSITRPSAGVPATGVLLALGAVALWSTNALAGSTALERLPVGVVLLVQCATAAAALGAVRYARRHRTDTRAPLAGADRRYLLLLGGLGFGGTLVLQYLSFAHAPIVDANLIAYAWPMFAAVWLAITGFGRRSAVALACVGFAGVGLIVGSGDGLSGGGNAFGYAAALGSAVCMAFYSLGSGRARVRALDAMLCGALAGTLPSLALVVQTGASLAPTVDWLYAAYIGIGPCAAGYAAWSAAMAHSGGRLAAVGYATPLLSTIVLLAAGRPVSGAGTAVGGALILVCTIGVVLTARRPSRPEGSPARPATPELVHAAR